jgi:hypothetical protein
MMFEKGKSEWRGIILGAKALDCQERGGLGFKPGQNFHVFESLGIMMDRMEDSLREPDPNGVYSVNDKFEDGDEQIRPVSNSVSCRALRTATEPTGPRSTIGQDPCRALRTGLSDSLYRSTIKQDPCRAERTGLYDTLNQPNKGYCMFPMRLQVGKSAVDSSDEEPESEAFCHQDGASMMHAFSVDGQDWGDPVVFDGTEEVTLEQGEAVMLPVRRSVQADLKWTGNEAIVVIKGHPLQVVPGIWETGQELGSVLVVNEGCSDFYIALGDAVGLVVPVAMQTRECPRCGCFDTDAWVLESGDSCKSCGRPLPGGPSICRACGKDEVNVLHYSGCQDCAPSVFGPVSVANASESMSVRVTQGRTVCSASKAAESLVASHSVTHAVYHIVEELGGVDWMTEVETPPEAYYDLLRVHLASKYPEANPHLLDHMIS